MDDQLRCSLCRTMIPLAKSSLGKTLGGGIASTLGIAKSKTVGGVLAFGLIGVVVGHFVDVLIDEATQPICGRCQQRTTT